jgi:predicted small lipoprotein YifL
MKKKLVLLLVLAMVMLAFAACGGGTEPPEEPQVTPTTGDAKTGLAVITSTGKTVDAGEENGIAQVDSVVVAVTVDDAGTILNCAIDTAQTKIEISN